MDESEQGAAHKYLVVRDHLAGLVAQELRVGDAIPSERHLSQQFGLSRMTVRQAVDTLVTDGVLVREQGRGTFVAPQRIDFEMRLTTFGEEMRRRGMEPATTVLTAQVVAATPGRRHRARDRAAPEGALPLPGAQRRRHAHLHRAGLGARSPWRPDCSTTARRPACTRRCASVGLAPEWGEDTLSADEATDTEASLLGLGDARAVLRAERRTYSVDAATMFSRACYRADRYSVWVPLRAPRPALVPRRRPPVDAGVVVPDETEATAGGRQ